MPPLNRTKKPRRATRRMKLLLIDPKPTLDVYSSSLVSAPSCPSLTLAMLAGTARAAGHEVDILDLRLEADPAGALDRTLDRLQPEVVGLGAYTMTFSAVRRIAAAVRQKLPDVLLLTGGVHPNVMPDQTLAETAFDAVVLGEGELTLTEILAGRPLAEVAGLVYREGESYRRTEPRELIKSLDELCDPAYDLFTLNRYATEQSLWKSRRIAMSESSRGCPFRCSFCVSRSVFGNRWRAKSPDRVIDEIQRLLGWGFQEIHFQDDGFTTDLPRAKEICRKIIDLPQKLLWELYNGIRIDRVDEEFLALAKRAGCYRIRFGVESGDQQVLDGVGKGLKLAQIKEVFALVRRQGIETIALFILGLPDDTAESMARTASFACELKSDFMRAAILVPYPGSPIFEQWDAEGRILSHDWDDYHFHQREKFLFDHPHLSSEQLVTAYRRMYRKYYLRPGYFLSRIYLGLIRGGLRRELRYFFGKFVLGFLTGGRRE